MNSISCFSSTLFVELKSDTSDPNDRTSDDDLRLGEMSCKWSGQSSIGLEIVSGASRNTKSDWMPFVKIDSRMFLVVGSVRFVDLCRFDKRLIKRIDCSKRIRLEEKFSKIVLKSSE
ncbi:hypothetical protein O9G_002788 [Rozella allomycis CSF55]|uniref:Uncharacterized protein n=1 Tax=Rozella allomycis (strain CSF55) TaxID=988480 RepID=A0A075AMN3_ROZAC|nr:hypothetical protein O9G_002788 [Rozella allomycis CSF55]|eukprot:EPZ30911.1 hypothetical protein O9G_002788 [Rozella allomycis CSF55]